jgi:hypothetical protein
MASRLRHLKAVGAHNRFSSSCRSAKKWWHPLLTPMCRFVIARAGFHKFIGVKEEAGFCPTRGCGPIRPALIRRSDQFHYIPLCGSIAFDIRLGHAQRRVTSQLLHIA